MSTFIFIPSTDEAAGVKFATPANVASNTSTQTLVAAVTGKKIRVIGITVMAGATATDVTFKSATTAITPLFACGVNGGWARDGMIMETAVGEALNVTTGIGSAVGILLSYIEAPA